MTTKNKKSTNKKIKAIELHEATLLDRFCTSYSALSERQKDVEKSANLFNKFVRMYFFDRENCCLDEKKGVDATKKMLIIYFKCNNALYGEWEYLAKGIISASAPYHQIESDDVDDWTDTKTTNVSINWLQKNWKQARKLSNKGAVKSGQKETLVLADMRLVDQDHWIQDDLLVKTLKNNIKKLEEDHNLYFVKVDEHNNIALPQLKSIEYDKKDILVDNKSFIHPPFSSRKEMIDLLSVYCGENLKPKPAIQSQPSTAKCNDTNSENVVSKVFSSVVVSPPSSFLKQSSSTTSSTVTKVSHSNPQRSTVKCNASLKSVASVVSPQLSSAKHSSASSTSTELSNSSDSSPVIIISKKQRSTSYISQQSASSIATELTNSSNSSSDISKRSTSSISSHSTEKTIMSQDQDHHLHANSHTIITTYNYRQLGEVSDYTSLREKFSNQLNVSITEELTRRQNSMDVTVETVLRLLQYEQQFATFFKDLEKDAQEEKDSAIEKKILDNPRMDQAQKTRFRMLALKHSRKFCKDVGSDIVKFVKLCLTKNRAELLEYFQNDNANLLDSFLDDEVIEDLCNVVTREDELNVELSKEPYYTHRKTLSEKIQLQVVYFTSLEYVKEFLTEFTSEIQKHSNSVFEIVSNYAAASNPLKTENHNLLDLQSTVPLPLNPSTIQAVSLAQFLTPTTPEHPSMTPSASSSATPEHHPVIAPSLDVSMALSNIVSNIEAVVTANLEANIDEVVIATFLARLDATSGDTTATTTLPAVVLNPATTSTETNMPALSIESSVVTTTAATAITSTVLHPATTTSTASAMFTPTTSIASSGVTTAGSETIFTPNRSTTPTVPSSFLTPSPVSSTDLARKRETNAAAEEPTHMPSVKRRRVSEEEEEESNSMVVDNDDNACDQTADQICVDKDFVPADMDQLFDLMHCLGKDDDDKDMSETANRISYLIRNIAGQYTNIFGTKNMLNILIQPIVDVLGGPTVLEFAIDNQNLWSSEDKDNQYEKSSDDDRSFDIHGVVPFIGSQNIININNPQSVHSSSSSSFMDLTDIAKHPTDDYIVYNGILETSNFLLPAKDSKRKFLQNLVVHDVSKTRNQPNSIKGAWCLPKFITTGTDQHNLSIPVVNALVAMLNLILFGVRHMGLKTFEPATCGNHFYLWLALLKNTVDGGQFNVNMHQLWTNIEDFITIPTTTQSQSAGEFDNNSFEVICKMMLSKIYTSSCGYKPLIVEVVFSMESSSNKTQLQFETMVRNTINEKNKQLLENNSSQEDYDDSIILISFKHSSALSLDHYSFPLVISLDVPHLSVAPNHHMIALYKLVGTYYRSTDGKNIALSLSALDSLGVEIKFEWNDLMEKNSTASSEQRIIELPTVGCDGKERNTNNLYKPFPCSMTRKKILFKAEGLMFVLSPTQKRLFKHKTFSTTTGISNYLHEDPVVDKFNISIESNVNLYVTYPNQWLNDEIINFMALSIREKFDSPNNVLISTFCLTYLLDDKKSTDKFVRSSKCIRDDNNLLFDDNTIIHFPFFKKPDHWAYFFVSMHDKMIYVCDSMNSRRDNSSSSSSEQSELLKTVAPMILSLLLYEHGNRVENHSLPPDHVFDVLTWQARDFPVPVQKDGCNCGVFVILNMYRMMKNVKDNSPMEVNYTKQYTPAELLKLRKLIVDICYMRATIEDFEDYNP